MNIEYHRWWSPHLGHDMELKSMDTMGKAIVVFHRPPVGFMTMKILTWWKPVVPSLTRGTLNCLP